MESKRYEIIEKIDAGGMAEVWKARSTSLKGFEKLVAIKRVLPTLTENKRFLSMFLDEARLSLHLNHANIVQTFDIGQTENGYFIVMEWIDGTHLKSIIETAAQQQFRVPKEQAVYIISEVCKALTHAHLRRDEQGQSLGIVHRDVSPPNVLISREGEVKLVDFGLAKAQSQLTATDPGVVKGKFGYLSPEGAFGRTVDARADIFSAGSVLWELLAGKRLFDGKSNIDTVQQVRAAEIPSLMKVNHEVDEELNAIVMKALAKEPEQRYATAEAFGHALTQYLFSNRLMVTNYAIAVLVKRVLAARETTRPMRVVSAQMQDDIGSFVSLDDLDRMPFVSVSASFQALSDGDEAGGGESVDEDPRSWAGEFELDGPSDSTAKPADIAPPSIPTPPIPPSLDDEQRTAPPSRQRGLLAPPQTPEATGRPVSIEPVIQRVTEPSMNESVPTSTRVSLMEFTGPPVGQTPEAKSGSLDRSIIAGIIGGLIGAAVIIYLTLYLFEG